MYFTPLFLGLFSSFCLPRCHTKLCTTPKNHHIKQSFFQYTTCSVQGIIRFYRVVFGLQGNAACRQSQSSFESRQRVSVSNDLSVNCTRCRLYNFGSPGPWRSFSSWLIAPFHWAVLACGTATFGSGIHLGFGNSLTNSPLSI